ncbi:MAG: serine/threonine protein kinase, partial [Myxococcota bacterium]
MRDLRQRFQVLREIPGPRTAAVFHALDRISGREVAVKTLPVDHDQAQELRDEAGRHSGLRHPRLAPFSTRFEGVLGFDDRTVTGFATQWALGEPLDAWVRARTVQQGLDAMATVVGVVQWLHRRRWLHLDLKPDNVLGTADGPVLLDLGTARPISSGTRSAGGTLGFAAPEVVRGQAPAEQSDLFSIGVLMFSAFGGELDDSLMRGLATQELALPTLGLFRSDLPVGVIELVDRLRASRPHDRPESCEEVLDALYAAGAARPQNSLLEVGEPAFVERSDLVHSVVERLDEGAASAIAVLGDTGMGRSRFAREVLWRLDVGDGRIVQDLSSEPLACLERLLHSAGAPGSGRLDDPRLPPWLIGESRLKGTFFLGRFEDLSNADADRIRALAPKLVAGGVSVLVASHGLELGLSPVGLAPLSTGGLRAIATDLGHRAYTDFEVVCGVAAGRPGSLIDALTHPRPALESLDLQTQQMAQLLRWLPAPVPYTAVSVLPERVQRAIEALAECGRMKARGQGWWHDLDLPIDAEATDEVRDLASTVLAQAGELELVWRARLCARVGFVDEPRRWLQGLGRAQQEAPNAVEVAERLGLQGEHWAALIAARTLAIVGPPERVNRLLDGIDESEPGVAQARMTLMTHTNTRLVRRAGADFLEGWLSTYGEQPEIRARYYYLLCAVEDTDAIEARIAEDEVSKGISSAWKETRFGLSVQAVLLCARCKADASEQPALRRLMLRMTQGCSDLVEVDPLLLFFLREAARALGDREQAMQFAHVAVTQADAVGDLNRAALARYSLGTELHDFCQAEPARRVHREALSLYEQSGDVGAQLRSLASLADLEIHSGRLASAEVLLRRFDELKATLPYHPEAEVRGKVLWAAFHSVHLRPEQVVNLLEGLGDLDKVPPIVVFYHGLYLAEAYVDLGAHTQARDLLEALPPSPLPTDNIRLRTARGRAYIGVGRSLLQQAVPPIDIEPDALDQE